MPRWKRFVLSVAPVVISIPITLVAIKLINKYLRWW